MQEQMIAVYDKKTAQYQMPHSVPHVADGIRWWDQIRKNPENKIGRTPEDFELCHIGTIDVSKASFTNIQPVITLAPGV